MYYSCTKIWNTLLFTHVYQCTKGFNHYIKNNITHRRGASWSCVRELRHEAAS